MAVGGGEGVMDATAFGDRFWPSEYSCRVRNTQCNLFDAVFCWPSC